MWLLLTAILSDVLNDGMEVGDGLDDDGEVIALGESYQRLNEVHVHFHQYVHVDSHHTIGDLDTESDYTGVVFLQCHEHDLHDDLPTRLKGVAAQVGQHGHATQDVLADRHLIRCRFEVVLENLLERLQELTLELIIGQFWLLHELTAQLFQLIDRVHG